MVAREKECKILCYFAQRFSILHLKRLLFLACGGNVDWYVVTYLTNKVETKQSGANIVKELIFFIGV